mmetsp:Transcript_58647/g.106928  ORF Transcript_58647/g.106928 Transcript_58647/m.106928 type:complete len:222 (+) Transcript_58647:92-757(+)
MAADAELTIIGGAGFRTFRNIWMLEELGVPYRHLSVEPLSPEAKAVNPLGKVPSLKDGHLVLFESVAINTYLGDKFRGSGRPVLVPAVGTRQRAFFEQWNFFIQSELDAQGLWICRKHRDMGHIFGVIPDAVEHAKKTFQRCLKVVARDLQKTGGPYLLGKEFSATDILLVHCLNWAEVYSWFPAADAGSEMATLRDYFDRCRARDGFRRATAIKQSQSKL